MPTKTYEHLPPEKKERLLAAIRQELQRVPFEQVSINRIVQTAGISRGSFYQYFSGKDPENVPPIRIHNITPFRQEVIEIMNTIPYGQTMTYGDISRIIAKHRGLKRMSAQAVGGAVGWNPICIIIPCHRVIGTNGSLIGYAGGIEKKIRLLELEGVDVRMLSPETVLP